MVSVPDILSIREEEGMVEVCAELSTFEPTEENITLNIFTSNNTAGRNNFRSENPCIKKVCMYARFYLALDCPILLIPKYSYIR